MSTLSVNTKIKAAMQNAFVTRAEARAIVKEAEKRGVTPGEGKAVESLFEKGTPTPGHMVTMAIPENPGDVTFEIGAKKLLDAFFERNHIPAGSQKEPMKNRIKLSLDGRDLGPALAKAPDVRRLFAVEMHNPLEVMRDIPMETAFLDLKKGSFYIKLEGGFVRDPRPRFFGPFQLQPVASGG